jgi:hypothetical protein
MAQSTFTQGRADFSKLQSLFGLARMLGGGEALAWSLQGAAITAGAILVGAVWRSRAAYALKAAALATGALIATPYLYLYDLVVLAVPMAYLIRAGHATRFLPGEWACLGVASLMVFVYPFVQAPVGLVAIAIVASLVARRLAGPRPALAAASA